MFAVGCALKKSVGHADGTALAPAAVVFGVIVMLGMASIGAAVEDQVSITVEVGRVRGRKREVVLAEVQAGVRLEVEAALFFSWMREAAEEDGVMLKIRSGFRSFREQKRLYRCFVECSCNGCRRAARPGYSPHESGRAIDLSVRDRRVRGWLRRHARRFGFVRTVKSEPWHFEYRGGRPGIEADHDGG